MNTKLDSLKALEAYLEVHFAKQNVEGQKAFNKVIIKVENLIMNKNRLRSMLLQLESTVTRARKDLDEGYNLNSCGVIQNTAGIEFLAGQVSVQEDAVRTYVRDLRDAYGLDISAFES